MSKDLLEIDDELPGYRALERSATIMGMPMVPVAFSLCVPLFFSMFLMSFIGAKAYLTMLVSVPLLGFIYTQTQQDDQALRIFAIKLQWVLRRRNFRLFGHTNTILGNKFGPQYEDYKRFFENVG